MKMLNNSRLWSLKITTAPSFAEAFSNAFDGDALAVTIISPPRSSTAFVEALYENEPQRAEIFARVAILAKMNKTKTPKIEIRETPKLDWLKKVAGDFPPLALARWTVFGSSYRLIIPRRTLNIQIDATSAFGTGEHPTTRGCLQMLDWYFNKTSAVSQCQAKMLDVGCGSGILAMAWAQVTRGRAVAVDNDEHSVVIARANLRINGLQKHVRIVQGEGYKSPLIKRTAPFDLIMANIFAGPLKTMAQELKRHLKPGGAAIVSGILNHQTTGVVAAHCAQGLRLRRRHTIGEWSVLAFQRPPSAK